MELEEEKDNTREADSEREVTPYDEPYVIEAGDVDERDYFEVGKKGIDIIFDFFVCFDLNPLI
jgi:hypothetical protein